MVDAKAAVDLATNWTNLSPWRMSTGTASGPNQPINEGAAISSSLVIDNIVGFVEFVEINVDIEHRYFRDLKFELTSPSGNRSTLGEAAPILIPTPIDGNFRFGSARHLGEDPAGTWSLRVTDRVAGETGQFRSWSMTVYGHSMVPNQPTIGSISAGDRSITMSWTAPDDHGTSDITKYDLRYIRSDASDKSDARWTTHMDITTVTYEITSLEAGVYYDIEVRAHNDGGSGIWSNTGKGNTSPVAPATSAAPTATARAGELLVFWTPPTTGQVGISRYDVRYIRTDEDETDDNNWTERTAWSGSGELSDIIPNLVNGVSYDLQVRATNSVGTSSWSSTRTGTPMVSNQDPAFPISETGMRSVNENTAAGQSIGAAVQATDRNGDPLTYDLTGSDADDFEINKVTGQLQTLTELDYEGIRKTYSVNVVVSDNKDVNAEGDPSVDATQPVTITVENVNEAPTVSGGQVFEFREDRGYWEVGSYSASDPENDMITWSLTSDDRGDFQIDQSGNLSFREPPDADRPADQDQKNTYEVNVVASDGTLRGELDVMVEVENVDEAPEITGRADIDYRENSTAVVERYSATDPEGGTVTWSLPMSDQGTFTLTNGQLRFQSPPNYEASVSYNLTVRAFDGSHTRSLPVTINVTDLDEAETLSLATSQPVQDIDFAATFTEADRITTERGSGNAR